MTKTIPAIYKSDAYEPTIHDNAETYSSDDDVQVEEGRRRKKF